MSTRDPRFPWFEAAVNETTCGRMLDQREVCAARAVYRIEWKRGWQSVACEPHVTDARALWGAHIARVSTWRAAACAQ